VSLSPLFSTTVEKVDSEVVVTANGEAETSVVMRPPIDLPWDKVKNQLV
jgi:hypothetical protein